MRTHFTIVAVVLVLCVSGARAATTINSINHYAYGANIGWVNARGNVTAGAVIGEYVCSGYLYAANVGWIHLGSNAPANRIQYQNNSATDYGVNHDGLGNLRGYAYGANIGWINFENTGAPRVDLKTGRLDGAIYSANCGWISLSNAFAQVQTDIIASAPDTDGNLLADAWELQHFGMLGVNASADPDHDGMSNLQEYLAGTDPNDASDKFVLTAYALAPGGTQVTLAWKSALTRCYQIEKTLNLSTPVWTDSGLGLISPGGVSTSRTFMDTNAPTRFYRVKSVKPLAP